MINHKQPSITVFIPVFNGEKFIRKSIDSILNQTFADFELLIINDGSTDNSVQIINSYKDKRIRLIHNEINRGLTFTRNKGLIEAKGKYFALLDADDIAFPERLEIQYSFISKNNEIAICGSSGIYINENDIFIEEMKRQNGQLNASLLFSNQLINSSVILNTQYARDIGSYKEMSPAEDFDLAFRLSKLYKIYNLPHILVKYRLHESNITKTQSNQLTKVEKEIATKILSLIDIPLSEQNIVMHSALIAPNHLSFSISKWIKYFKILNSVAFSSKYCTNNDFKNQVQNQFKLVFLSHKRSLKSFRYLYNSLLIFKKK